MKKKIIPYSRQSIDDDDIREVNKVLRSDFITQGPLIEDFENGLAKKAGACYAAVLNSGTSALHAAYFAAGITQGDEIITTPLTFAATSNAALYLGAKPVFSDVESDTGNLDLRIVRDHITEKTRLIVPVHYSGHPVDLEGFQQLTSVFEGVKIIEDASHALGAMYRGEPVGNCKYSDMVISSFHPVKHITTGEGGVVFTNEKEYYDKIIAFRSHGITKRDFMKPSPGPWYYEMQYLGYNYRITDIQAALGLSQLKKLDRFVQRRREIAYRYNQAFGKNESLIIPTEKEYARSSYHLYPLRLADATKRAIVFNKLRKEYIWVQVHYIPVYLQPYYQQLGYPEGICPVAEDYYNSMISIPIYPDLSDEEQDQVIHLINRFVDES